MYNSHSFLDLLEKKIVNLWWTPLKIHPGLSANELTNSFDEFLYIYSLIGFILGVAIKGKGTINETIPLSFKIL